MTDPSPGGVSPGDRARRLAKANPDGWFEELYASAAAGEAVVPWDAGVPNDILTGWAFDVDGTGQRALVVGCGLGDDAEFIASIGFQTTAFDVSASAIELARLRYPQSTVDYAVADLFDPPSAWHQAFDLVIESATVQAMPQSMRVSAIDYVTRFVAPGGRLLVIARSRPTGTTADGPPWPLTSSDMDEFAKHLFLVRREHTPDDNASGRGFWLAEYTRQQDSPRLGA